MKVVKGFVQSYTVTKSKYGVYANYKIMEGISVYTVKGKCLDTDTIVS